MNAIVTAPEGIPLVVVKVQTSDDGLYGLGCATFTQRFPAVVAAVDECVAPFAIGRHPADIEDLTRAVHYSSYWRNGPVLNNALSGLDMALWDIAGKRLGVPVYELLGGRGARRRTHVPARGRAQRRRHPRGSSRDHVARLDACAAADRAAGPRQLWRSWRAARVPGGALPRRLGRRALPAHHTAAVRACAVPNLARTSSCCTTCTAG